VCRLIDQETQQEPRTQLQLMMEPILDHFPSNGLLTTCATDLLMEHLVNFQGM
jgi:hypothetical protein